MKPSVAIVGVGNVLSGDDGLGPRAVQVLQGRQLPEGVRVLDAGTLGPDLLVHVPAGEAVVLMDAVRGGGPPGKLYRFALDSLGDAPSVPLSVHELGIHELLREARLLGRPLRGVLLGVEPARIVPGEASLSPPVQDALEPLVKAAVEEAQRLLHEAPR